MVENYIFSDEFSPKIFLYQILKKFFLRCTTERQPWHTMTLYERHGVSNCRQFDCVFSTIYSGRHQRKHRRSTSEFNFNSLTLRKFELNSRKVSFKLNLKIGWWGISCEMSQDLTGNESTLVQVMAWCRQATSHYLSQCWPRAVSPYGVTRPQWVNSFWPTFKTKYKMLETETAYEDKAITVLLGKYSGSKIFMLSQCFFAKTR